MPAPSPRLGVHLPLGGGLLRAAERAGEIGANAIQIFADNPTAWRRRGAPPPQLERFRARLAELDVAPIAVHASYLVNLAGPEPRFRADSIAVLVSELQAGRQYGARFVNVHTGSHRETSVEAGIRRVADAAAEVLDRATEDLPAAAGGCVEAANEPATARSAGDDPPMLVLENAAGGGWSVGASIQEVVAIAEAAAVRGVPESRLGFCVDTAHAWGAGVRMDDPEAIDRFLDDFDRRLGLRRLVLVHLNDTRSELGSRRDWHEHLGAGRIGERGLGHLARHPAVGHATFILETPGMTEGYDAINLARARALLAGEPLEPLPAAAFELRAGRTRGAAPPVEATA